MDKKSANKIRVWYVQCHKDPNYVRSTFIVETLRLLPKVEVMVIDNRARGLWRYPQVIWRTLVTRLRHRPDLYILGFRGYEVFAPIRLITAGKPLIYDEFINPYLWFVEEHQKFASKSLRGRLLRRYTVWMLRHADKVLSDTDLHANYSSQHFSVLQDKFTTLYVGTDEKKFKPIKSKTDDVGNQFDVFFYGNFLPLHGLDTILEAAKLTLSLPIKFTIIGGAGKSREMGSFLRKLADYELDNVVHKPWVKFEELPGMIASADLCLGGPFGDTPQARKVITGKTYQFLAMGKPTVVGRVHEPCGFKDKANCLLVHQGSGQDLCDAIEWSYRHQEKLRQIGLSGQRLYDKQFSMSAQQGKLKELIKSLV